MGISGPVLVMVLEKENAVADWRDLIGPTDAHKAKVTHPHSIRAMCGLDSEKNCIHGSDSTHQLKERSHFSLKRCQQVQQLLNMMSFKRYGSLWCLHSFTCMNFQNRMTALPNPLWWRLLLDHLLLKVVTFLTSPALSNFIGSCDIDPSTGFKGFYRRA
ncbi:hypothetical protein I3842_Q127500 [Carya illinoinensis]|uniref:Nucleoside diphosphate kinase-like domain-containing protein n=1 Tax=Carya illinoinensis TaxID=32201 RepID=A0A922D6E5_CARIL|nr:hypothetical protein I3842_Q127500 [Carya illinoinensis]